MTEGTRQVSEWKTADTLASEEIDHPSGKITLSPRRMIGARVAALGGLAVGALAAASPVIQAHTGTTSGP
jgi:hypothetical protein